MSTAKIILLACAIGYGWCKSPYEGSYLEGDMRLSREEIKDYYRGGTAISYILRAARFWKYARGETQVIPYSINSNMNAKGKRAIKSAVRSLKTHTCLRFKKMRESKIKPRFFMHFTNKGGCSSPVGRKLNGNIIQFGEGCHHTMVAVHEIMHSLGFYHEHSRPDRDNYVKIYMSQVSSSGKRNFLKRARNEIDSLGVGYNYDSVMHYGGRDFSNTGKYTIRTKDPRDQSRLGQRTFLSLGDATLVNRLYCR